MQKRLQSQLDQLKHEIEECECEVKREKKSKRSVNQSAITKLESDIKNHNDCIHNLELILRQLDNNYVDPYKLDEVLDAVDNYLLNYKQPDYYFDSSLFDSFSRISDIPKSASDSEPSESDETDSLVVRIPEFPSFLERKVELRRRLSRFHPAKSRGFRPQNRHSRQLRRLLQLHPRDSRDSRDSVDPCGDPLVGTAGFPGSPGNPDYPHQLGVEK